MARVLSRIVGGAKKIGGVVKKAGQKFAAYQEKHEKKIKEKMKYGYRP